MAMALRAMTTDEYIALTRATEHAVYHGMKGVSKIGLQDIPALLNHVTGGSFKFYWSSYILDRSHIKFERLDDERKFSEMRAMLVDEELGNFLRWHMSMTKANWVWNFFEEP